MSRTYAPPADSEKVAQEVSQGEGINLAQAARLMPPGASGKAVSPQTVWRWSQIGVSMPDGSRVRLEVARVGCRWLTSRPAVARFIVAQNRPASEGGERPAPSRADNNKRRRKKEDPAQVLAELNRLGV